MVCFFLCLPRQALFDREAKKNDVYPLGASTHSLVAAAYPLGVAAYPLGANFGAGKPPLTAGRQELVFLPTEPRISPADVPPFGKLSYRMSADVVIPDSGAQGVLVAFGNRDHGFVWYIKEDRVVYENTVDTHHERITSRIPLPHGKVNLAYEFRRDNASAPSEYEWKWETERTVGTGRLYINEEWVGEKRLSVIQPCCWTDTLYIGRAATIGDAYKQRFTGTLGQVKVELK